MAKNDRLLLDGIIDDRVIMRLPSEKRDEAFEYLAFEQILKDFDLSSEEIAHGTVDGRRDGGIDGFFILVNGHPLQDPESFIWPRSGSELQLTIITCKHHDTFKQATLDSLIATITEIFDFSIEDANLTGAYSEALLQMRGNLKYAYRKLSPRLAKFTADIYYASRGDTSEIGAEVEARARQIEALIAASFGTCEASFSFVGSTELVELHRKTPNHTLELPFVEALAKGERYVVLAKLSDYFNFVSDAGKLRRYLFESNVRDFMGLNAVNEDIKSTLEAPSSTESPDFWWLNNGVTILVTSAAITGKSIRANDVQIVNGLQTTESIFRHFSSAPSNDDRCVLVKVIVTQDDAVRDAIIRATNNQTNVELASLHATDRIQRNIEDVLQRHGIFYERRKNFYANQGHTPAELVTPLYAAAGYVALALKAPEAATALRSKFMRNPDLYETVFNEDAMLEVWPKIVQIMKKVDVELEALRANARATDKFLKAWRYITAFILVAKKLGRFNYSPRDLADFDVSQVTHAEVASVWIELNSQGTTGYMGGWASRRNVIDACTRAAATHSIDAIQAFVSSRLYPPPVQKSINISTAITDDFIAKVKALIPPQPWKPGLHRKISTQLRCDTTAYFAAVERLIEDGEFLRQRDGVLYDRDGNVVSVDLERVDPQTLELKEFVTQKI